VRLAVWFGLLTGIVEAAVSLMLPALGTPTRVSMEILWIAPAVNAGLFVLAGISMALTSRVLHAVRHDAAVMSVCVSLTAFACLLVADLIEPWSALVLAAGVGIAVGRHATTRRRIRTVAVRAWRPVVLMACALGVAGFAWHPVAERISRAGLPPVGEAAPNVLLVVLDTLRADHVSAYGYARSTTPRLDGLAEHGVLFEQAFANSSWTLPSHASLLTGRLPGEHGADWREPMRAGIPTLAEAFAARGYATAAFAANTSYVAPEWGLGPGFTRFEVYGSSWADDVVRTAYGRRLALNLLPRLGYFDIPGRKRAPEVNREFLSWLDAADGRPFFAFLNYLDVHDPYVTDAPHHQRFSTDAARGDVINFQFQPHAFRRQAGITAAEIQAEIDAYDGCLTYLDEHLGRLFDEIARRGLDGSTLVVVTSDHGESFGEHDLFGHGNSLFLESLHVPLIVSWPGHVPAGVRVAGPVGLDRVARTIDELARPDAASAFPGRSLVDSWRTDRRIDEPVISEVTGVPEGPAGYPTSRGSLTSLLTREWHLIQSASGGVELYAWVTDRSERTNLAGTAEGGPVVDALRRTAERLRSRTP